MLILSAVVDAAKRTPTTEMDLQELVLAREVLKAVAATYTDTVLDVPEELQDRLAELSRAIGLTQVSAVEAKRKRIKQRLESLKPDAERRQELMAELARLDAS